MGRKTVGTSGDSSLVLDAYGRVSRLGDKRMRTVEGQLGDCKERIEEYGATVGEVLADPGRSAWNPDVKRPKWDILMTRLETRLSNGVCVFDLSRFTRRPIEGERLIQIAERGLVVLDSEHEFDLTTADGKASFRDQMKMAAYYSDRLSTTVKRGKRLRAKNGQPNGTHRAFGFEPDGVTLRMAEVAVMREVVRRLLEGDGDTPETLDAIVVDLNDREIFTTAGACPRHDAPEGKVCGWCGRKNATRRGDGTWTSVTLKQMLLKERNAGHIEYNGTNVGRLPGEPIFDVATWADLNALFAARRRGRPNSETYLCSGIAVCGLCHHGLSGRPRRNMKPYPDGQPRRQYWCQPRTGAVSGCGRISVDQRALDEHAEALALSILSSPDYAEQIETAAKARKAAGDTRSKMVSKIADLDHKANELAARLGREDMSLARYDAASAPLEKRLTKLREELKVLDSQRPARSTVSARVVTESRKSWKKRWDAATTAEKRALLRQALGGRALVVDSLDVHRPRVFHPNRVRVENF